MMDLELEQHWKQINQQRTAFYGWFAGAFASELSKQAFAFYSSAQLDSLLAVLEHIGFEQEVARLQAFTSTLEGTEDERIELMADFASCFLLDSRQSALPYASYYLSEEKLLYGEANQRMSDFLQGNQLQLHEDFREPADHLVVYLAVMADWCSEVAELNDPHEIERQVNEQYEFLSEALLSWLPQWAERLEQIPHLRYTFYPAMGQLLLSYVRADAQAMRYEPANEQALTEDDTAVSASPSHKQTLH